MVCAVEKVARAESSEITVKGRILVDGGEVESSVRQDQGQLLFTVTAVAKTLGM